MFGCIDLYDLSKSVVFVYKRKFLVVGIVKFWRALHFVLNPSLQAVHGQGLSVDVEFVCEVFPALYKLLEVTNSKHAGQAFPQSTTGIVVIHIGYMPCRKN